MSEENGAANGDVPEIELIIKEEPQIMETYVVSSEGSMHPQQLEKPLLPVIQDCSKNDRYIIYELKSRSQSTQSYIVTNPKELPPDPKEPNISENIISSVTEVIAGSGPQYTISFEIPTENDQTDICPKKRLLTKRPPTKRLPTKRPLTKRALFKMKRALARERLAEALDAVVNKDMSIGKAAKAFEVTKSTLWREVNKHTNHRKKKVDKDLNKQIGDRICAGESLSAIARSLNIAKSTIHLHKVRLAQTGQLPSNVTFKPPADKMEQLGIKERIIGAYRAIRVNGMSLRFASEFFSVPRSTLWQHIQRFKASQKKQEKAVEKCNVHPKKHRHDEFNKNCLEETSGKENSEEEDSAEEDNAEDRIVGEDSAEEDNAEDRIIDEDNAEEDIAEDDSAEEDSPHESAAENEDTTEAGENTSDVQSVTSDEYIQDEFNFLERYCKEHEAGPSEEGDFFISFDFKAFEDFVKTELED